MKTAMIWGASGGIGKAILERLNQDDWTTLAVSRDSVELEEAADFSFDADFEDPSSMEQTSSLAAREVDGVDLWVYAAGDILKANVQEMRPEDWQRLVNINLSSAFFSVHSSMPLLNQDAHLFFIGGRSERLQLPGLSAYAASKAGMEAFTATLAKENRNLRVSLVRPTAVDTPLWEKVPLNLPAGALKPEQIAANIYEAYLDGHKGQLDLG